MKVRSFALVGLVSVLVVEAAGLASSVPPPGNCSGCSVKTSQVASSAATLILHNPDTGATLEASVQLFITVGSYSQNCSATQFICPGARCSRELMISKTVVSPNGGALPSEFDDVDVQLEEGGQNVGSSTGLTGSWSQSDTVGAACNSASLRFDYSLTITGAPVDWVASWSGDAASATFAFDCNSCTG